MPTSAANDKILLSQGPVYKINSDPSAAWNGQLIDGAGGLDTVYVNAPSTERGYFSFAFADDGIVTFTAASGTHKTVAFTNVDKLVFWDIQVTTGTTGNDSLTGTTTADTIYGFAGNDTIDGAGGADKMFGGSGNDTYTVDNAGDVITEIGGAGVDTVLSSVSHVLEANVETLTLTGSAAINATGNKSGNTLTGNSNANIITGGLGKDKLAGLGGADTFVFSSVKDSLAGTKHDFIKDFAAGSDKINLSGIDANLSHAGNDAFTLLTAVNSAFSHTAGELRFADLAAGTKINTIIEGDVDGDAVADFQIELGGQTGLAITDFVL